MGLDWLATLAVKVIGPVASWIHHWRERRVTPTVTLVREARRDGRALLREIKLAQREESSKSLTSRIVAWYGAFELKLAEAAPDVFQEFRLPGIPSGTVDPKTGVPGRWEAIPLSVLGEYVRNDLRTLREIEVRLTGSVPRVKLLRVRRKLGQRWRKRMQARAARGA